MSIADLYDSLPYGPAPEGADEANTWLDRQGRRFGCFIGGEWTDPASTFEVFNPATGAVIAEATQADGDVVDRAVLAAREALPRWQALGGHGRAKVLYAIARQVQKQARLFAVLETIDNGKPIRETRDLDIPLVARHFYHHAGWAQILNTEFPGQEPVGVCGQIIPWNFPLLMLAWKIAPALAAGNTVVLKPAEYTPLTALLFAQICESAGVPAGVVNIVTGDGETGRMIVEHPDVDKIAFTGSTEVGRAIRKTTAGTGKKLSLELGGKSPFLVFEDADLDSAVEGLVDAIWFNQGQVCCAGSRLLVQESIEERFLTKVRARMANLRVGNPLDKTVDIGAIVAPVQLERITELVRRGQEEGATLFQPSDYECPSEGCFYPPTLLSGVSPASTVAQVEIFGPVLVSMTFRTPKEAVELANNTAYGLAASVWTENVSLAHDVAAKVKAGTVWVNCTNQFDAASGFGGYRESGYGREGGREGLLEYLRSTGSPSPPAPSPSLLRRQREGVDRTHKLYIGGKQARPDSGYSFVFEGEEFARANRKDVRNAVEAARGALAGWSGQSGHARAQILYYLAENLEGIWPEAVPVLFEYAARADKLDGQVHNVPMRSVTYTINEPVGGVAVVCSSEPLSLIGSVAAAIAAGNTVVAVASESNPLPAALLYRVLEASDIPAGVVNLLTGYASELEGTLAEHDGVDAIWHFGPPEGRAKVERLSIGNLKQVWTAEWGTFTPVEALRHATQVKNVWIPYGA